MKRNYTQINPYTHSQLYSRIPISWLGKVIHVPRFFYTTTPTNFLHLKPFKRLKFGVFSTRWIGNMSLWQEFVKNGLAGHYVYITPYPKNKIPYWQILMEQQSMQLLREMLQKKKEQK
jgi:hypothetical protein